jgi:hypothetical protein
MQSRFKPPERRAMVIFGSIWLVAVLFVLIRAFTPL